MSDHSAFRRAKEEAAAALDKADPGPVYKRPGALVMNALEYAAEVVRRVSNPFPEEAEPQESALEKAREAITRTRAHMDFSGCRDCGTCAFDPAGMYIHTDDCAWSDLLRALSPAQDAKEKA